MNHLKPQLRTYVLVVGRDEHDQPVRTIRPYVLPLEGVTDHYEDLTNIQIGRLRAHIEHDIAALTAALVDLEAEAFSRLESL